MTGTHDPAVAFILTIGRALHQHGYPAHQLESILEPIADRLGLEAQFFSTPTSMMVGIGPLSDQRTFLLRVEPGSVDLGKMSLLDTVVSDVVAGTMSPAEGTRRIEEIVSAPPRYGSVFVVGVFALVAAAVARVLGGGHLDVIVSAVLGVVTGMLGVMSGRIRNAGPVFEPTAALLVSAIATACTDALGTRVYITTLAGLITLMPGLMLTTGLTELSTRHLASGTARLSGAVVTLLGIGFGVAFGSQLGASLLEVPGAPWHNAVMPDWTWWVALSISPLCYTVLLKAEPRDAAWIAGSGIAAFLVAREGTERLGEALGAFLGALAVSAVSNVLARITKRSPTLMTVPGILILVPGSIGFRSVLNLLEQEVTTGVATAFQMVLVGISLAAGLLVGNVLAPPPTVGEKRRLKDVWRPTEELRVPEEERRRLRG